MKFTLHCGHFHPELEDAYASVQQSMLRERANPLQEQILAVAPTGALRKRLVEVTAGSSSPLYGVSATSIHPLCMQIATPRRMVSDSMYYASLIQKIASQNDLLPARNFRICRAVYQTIRDLQDGGVTPSLLEEVLEAAETDPELQSRIHPVWLRRLASLAGRLEESLKTAGILNLPLLTRLAAEGAADYVRARRVTGLLVYGFYDSTEGQFDVIEALVRTVMENGGTAHAFFPFPVDGNRVEHPFEYAQMFLDRLVSLTASLGGTVNHLRSRADAASGGIERSLFAADAGSGGFQTRPNRRLEQLDLFAAPAEALASAPEPQAEIFSAAGEHDEAWAVAKRILKLVLAGVSFDQILVIGRSAGAELEPLLRAFRENRIPCNRAPNGALSCSPFAKFVVLALEGREAGLAPGVLMELLSSPFLPHSHGNDFRRLAELMENLIIRSWADWDRLEPLLSEDKLPQFYSFLEDQDSLNLKSLGDMVRRIQELKSHLQRIPERASLPEFAAALIQTLSGMMQEDAESRPVMELLRRIAGYEDLDEPELTLPGFMDSFKMYLQEADVGPADGDGVTVADIMQARGTSADFVFVTGLNRDVFPRRVQEDPFLPDSTRRVLRELTGAGPAEKRMRSLLPLKEGTDEELLLFGIALRTGRKQLFLSYRRADEAGRKAAISNYLDELLRLLTGKTSENNERIFAVPRHHASKFTGDSLPTLIECAALPARCSPEEWLELHKLSGEYAARVRAFGARLNHIAIETSREIDGIIEDPILFWKQQEEKPAITVSYSRLKSYLQCPFQFFARNILHLKESPRDAGQEDHDLDARLKGRMAEDVVKFAMEALRGGERGIETAVNSAARQIRHRYAPLLPPVLLDMYMDSFRAGAESVLHHLERNGFDLAVSETPQYENMIGMQLLPADVGLPPLMLRGIPDLILQHRFDEGLIGELKWGARSVGKSPGAVFSANEAQFCTYPELVRANRGVELPFRYLRMDAFANFGDPDDLLRRINGISVKTNIQKENAVRIFGVRVEFRIASEHLEKVRQRAIRLRGGDFRIVKDPNLQFGPCRHCSYTQICRRTHTETLLRAKRAEKE